MQSLKLPGPSGNSPQIYECYRCKKKVENLLFFRTVRRHLFTHTLLHHLSTTPYSLFTFLIHNARQFACEQALLLVDSREVARVRAARKRRLECEGRELARRRQNSEVLPLYSANFASFSESYCCHLSPQSFNSTCFVFSSHFVIF